MKHFCVNRLAAFTAGLYLMTGPPMVAATPQTEAEADTITQAPAEATDATVVSAWGPGLASAWWDQIVGTVVTSNDEWTSYCLFCRTDIDSPCTMAGGSLTLAMGPSTFFLSTISSSEPYTINCKVANSELATCTRTEEGSEEPSITSTYSEPNMTWGSLTLGERPASVVTLEMTTAPGVTGEDGQVIDQTDTRVSITPSPTNPISSALRSISTPATAAFLLGLGMSVISAIIPMI